MSFKNIIFVILAVLITVVVMQNFESVSLQVLFWEIEIPKIILLPIFLVIGYITGYFTGVLGRKKAPKPPLNQRPRQDKPDSF